MHPAVVPVAAVAGTWAVGSSLRARVGQDPPPSADEASVAWGEAQFRQGLTWGWIGGAASVIVLWGALALRRGQ